MAKCQIQSTNILDNTSTPMGARCLKRWLSQPLRNQQQLQKRQQAITEIIQTHQQEETTHILKSIGDVERILARIALRSARPRDLLQLRVALNELPNLQTTLTNVQSDPLKIAKNQIGTFPELIELLTKAIIDNPPQLIRDGGVIATGCVF